MTRKSSARPKIKGRFFAMPHDLIKSRQWLSLSANAKNLLLLIASNHNGHNNGTLIATADFLAPFGFGYTRTLQRSLGELLDSGLLCRTRLGGRNRPAWYALAWLDCDLALAGLQFPGTFQRAVLVPATALEMVTSIYARKYARNESTKKPRTARKYACNESEPCTQVRAQIARKYACNDSKSLTAVEGHSDQTAKVEPK